MVTASSFVAVLPVTDRPERLLLPDILFTSSRPQLSTLPFHIHLLLKGPKVFLAVGYQVLISLHQLEIRQ